ncbi:PRC-barrel domain-containing protein [Jiella pacifica]|uniref:PRC-barrel domain-containing protein n=1 Tax=Jiella pacifica TaxID=2696469 RepID=A0A6N9SV34_9HYPH|nr:PRC-barrel domain-containing protein [Jiella pacifica]NDW02917.1 hypothetical protein [Jiella pacifica]
MRNNLKAALFMSSILVAPAAFAQTNTAQNANDTTRENAQGAEADVVVQPDAPEVRVNVPEPDVTVDQAQPNVDVTQPRPTITVRQPAPNVTVDIPQPVITVRMPDPQVDVSQSQPQVSVSQGEPTVNVGEADQSAVETNDDGTQANVAVQQAQPQVNIQGADQRPEIRYEREEANVTVNQPEGQPQIRYEDSEGNAMERDTADAQNQTTASQDDAVNTASTSQQAGTQRNEADLFIAVAVDAAREIQMTVDEITEYDIVGTNGNMLGDIQNVANIDGKLFAVIGSGGFLGMGEKEVAIPLSSLIAENGNFVAQGISENQIEGLQEFDTDQYPLLDSDRTITLGSV